MAEPYFTEMDDLYRQAGLQVITVQGADTRGRGGGRGYVTGRCEAVINHHTASGPASDGWPSVNYGTFSADAKPIANEYVSRNGTIYFAAAGATNTNGAGGAWYGVPKDSLNSRAWGREIMNNGVGERYPDIQQDVVLEATAINCVYFMRRFGWTLDEVRVWRSLTHFQWAPTRKIDCWGPSRWNDYQARKWDMARFNADLITRIQQMIAPVPPPPPINPAPTNWVPVRIGDTGQRVVEVQFALISKGFPPAVGGADGSYGLHTAAAVENFQRSRGLPVFGSEVDANTAKALGFNVVELVPVPEPQPIPEPVDYRLSDEGLFRLSDLYRWPASVAGAAYGNQNAYAPIQAANPVWPGVGKFVKVPNVSGVILKVRTGDSLWSLLQRAYPQDDPRTRLANIQKWNGGSSNIYQGEEIFAPVNLS